MAEKTSYHEHLQQDLNGLIEALELPDMQKRFLRSRWLDQVLWLSRRADGCRNRHYFLRLTAIIGGVIVPALVSLNIGDGASGVVRGLTFSFSLAVAISVAIEGFLRFGERWRHYRRTEEALKTEGWQFLQLSGPYVSYENHVEAYPIFAGQVEGILQREVDDYITRVIREKTEKEGSPGKIVPKI